MHTANEMAIRIVTDYCARLNKQYCPYWRSSEFAQLSYTKMAAYEILTLLTNDKSTPPLQIIEEFRDKMSDYSCINQKNSFMYSVACDTADDISDTLVKTYV